MHMQSQIGVLQQQVRSLKQENGQLAEANQELKKSLETAESKQHEWESECNRYDMYLWYNYELRAGVWAMVIFVFAVNSLH